jgi:signal peptide peptidase SppA
MNPSSASGSKLLADFLCAPISMRSDRLFALVRNLNAGLARAADDATPGDDPECLPWDAPLYSVENGIAVLDVQGELVKGYDAFTCWAWGLASIDRLQAAVSEIASRPDVAAVIFRINSPGGGVTGTPELAAQIIELGQSRLTVAFTSDMACSGAYWIASACRQVLTTPSAGLGSIGVFIALYDYTEMLKEMGIKLELFAAGDYKAMGIAGNPLTDTQRAFLTEMVGRIYAQFTGFVRARRGAVADSTMQGQWFDGAQAVSLNLADRCVSGLPEVVAEIRAALNLAMQSAGLS